VEIGVQYIVNRGFQIAVGFQKIRNRSVPMAMVSLRRGDLQVKLNTVIAGKRANLI
jgi:hypothetical protein